MAKRKATQPPKASTSQAKPLPKAKKARFSNPTPSLPTPKSQPNKATPIPKTKIAQIAGPPKKFVVSAGSYERLLYGLECQFTQPDNNSTSTPKLQVNPIFSFPAHLSSLRTVAASSNPITEESGLGTERKLGGKYLVSGGQDEVIKVWDLQRRKEVGSLEGDTTGTITCLRFCPHRNMLLSASSDSTISLYRVRDWVLLRSLKGHKGRVNCIDPHPQGRVCLSVGKDKNLRMWDLVAGKSVATLKLGTEGDVVRWNTKGTKFGVITGSTLIVYGIDMSIHHTLSAPSRFHDLQFCIVSNKEYLFVGCEDGKTRVFDVSNPNPIKPGEEEDEEEFEGREKLSVCAELTGHTNRVKMMDLLEVALPTSTVDSPKSTIILTTASSDGRINLYDLSQLSTLSSTSKEIEPSATFDTDKSRLTSICAIGLLEKRVKGAAQGTEEDESASEDEEEEDEDEDDDELVDGKFAGEVGGEEEEEFEGIMINLSDNEIEEDSQDDGQPGEEDEDEDEDELNLEDLLDDEVEE